MSQNSLLDADIRAREHAEHLETLKPNPRTTRTILKIFLVALAIFVGTMLIVWNAKYTVISEEKHDDFSQISYGYQIEQYYFSKSSRVSFWTRHGRRNRSYLVYETPSVTVSKVIEERWINNNLAIYLNIEFTYHDSIRSISPTKIIYDFQRGEMHTFSNLTLFRIWNGIGSGDKWMNEHEFESILNRLDR